MAATSDPYKVLGLGPEASDEQLRSAYHRLVQANHPDHNQGSAESARRFEEIQEAYSRIRELRASRPAREAPPPSPAGDPEVDSRLADLERQVREAAAARERAQRAAAEATAAAEERERPSDEELGYVRTDDSFAKILDDAGKELTDRLSGAQEHPVGRRLTDLIDELAAKLKREDRS
jgi:curved DNA-binding protein CbpA